MPGIRAAQLVTPTTGWALTDRALRATADGGTTWTTITPPGARVDRIRSVSFLDALHGWAVVAGDADSAHRTGLGVLRTSDGGATWQSGTLAEPNIRYTDAPRDLPGAIDFTDPEHGWVVIRLGSSSNFSLGHLFQTADGGATWRKLTLPIGEPVRFVTATDGWAAGGPRGDGLYRSQDGGQSWQPQGVTPPAAFSASRPAYSLPSFFDGQNGVLPVTFSGDGTSPAGLAFYTTGDGGHSWSLATTIPEQAYLGLGVTLRTQVISPTSWMVLHPGGNRMSITRDGGRTTQQVALTGLPTNVADVVFVGDTTGWARAAEAECPKPATPPAKAACHATPFMLFRTTDGGLTWTALRSDE